MNKKQLIAKCKDLGIDTSGLDTNAKLKAAIEAKEAEIAETEATSETPEATQDQPAETSEETSEEEETTEEEPSEEEESTEEETSEEEEPAIYTDERGRKWTFSKNAPKTINIDGHSMTQEEILEAEDVISELVYGRSSFLTQIHK